MTWYDELDKWTADYLPDMPYEREVPLSRYTSFRIGGPARRMAFPQNGEQLTLLLSRARELSARPIILGNGTNLLFPDAGVDRLVIHTRDMNRVARVESDPCCLRADAGASLARVAMTACRLGLTGLEFAHGIPGSVGGAVCMNAGAYGGEMSQVVSSAAVLFPDEGIRTLTGEALGFSYRHSLLTDCPDGVVLSAVFRLRSRDPAAIRAKNGRTDDKEKNFTAIGISKRRKHLQAPGGPLRRCPDRPVRPEGADRGRRAGFREARRLRHQHRPRCLRRCDGPHGRNTDTRP